MRRLIPLAPAALSVVSGLDTRYLFPYCSRMPSRWGNDRPLSRTEFEARFPDDAACARYLAARRWPGGFDYPCCDGREGWELRCERITWQCTSCGRQTSVTAGTIIHGSHVSLRLWFVAVHIIKRTVLRLAFSERIAYCRNERLRTPKHPYHSRC